MRDAVVEQGTPFSKVYGEPPYYWFACLFIFRFWKRGGGFKEDDAVWAEPKMPQTTPLPELKPLNPDHCFVAALGTDGLWRLKLKNFLVRFKWTAYKPVM